MSPTANARLSLLQGLLAREHAAVYAVDVLGAQLSGNGRELARQADAAARIRRDRLAARIRELGGDPVAASAAYRLPFPLNDPAAPLRLAVLVEEDLATAYRTAVVATDDVGLRRFAVDALAQVAVTAARWRLLSGTDPVTVAFPGG